MSTRRFALAFALLVACMAPTSAQAAETAPTWQLRLSQAPSSFRPGTPSTEAAVFLYAGNVGSAPTTGPFTLTETLPAGITPIFAYTVSREPGLPDPPCTISGQTVSCEGAGSLRPGRHIEALVEVDVDPSLAEGALPSEARMEGGGAQAAVVQGSLAIAATPPPFDFLPGFDAPAHQSDGAPATAAGDHPYALNLAFDFPTERKPGGNTLFGDGHVRDVFTDLPPGEIVNPAATPVRCAQAQLVLGKCPDASAVGTLTVSTSVVGLPEAATFPLYNVVPPPGSPAMLGGEIFGVGIFINVNGEIRSDGDFGITGASRDILARTANPVFGVNAELWGDPSDPAHDAARGVCASSELSLVKTCPVGPFPQAQLTLPVHCPGTPLATELRADSWEESGVFKQTRYEAPPTDACNQLSFAPTISVQPSTDLADSPTGVDVTVHQPTDQRLGHLAPAIMRDIDLTLPEGLVANPSQADGLGACSEAQIGYLPEAQGVHFSRQPQSCPDAAKLGTVEVKTPLLSEYEEGGTKLATDPETGEPIPRPLQHGSVYLAEPFDNPFGSLLALYLAVEDPQSGTVAKLAGRVIPDPATGQLRTVFADSPQLPLEEVKVHLFGGPRAPLTTPPTCGTHTAAATLTPWSAPETPVAEPSSSFEIAAAPDGGACPSSAAQAANAPGFSAGTVSPQAGAYSPFVLKVSREDGSQRLAGIDTTLPPGLIGKLAGIPACSDGQIAQAAGRSHPNEGILERESPSCPLSTELGTVVVGAGAGPTPFYARGAAYLAGPYKGAPLSLAVITPAIAGPFDLGTVVTRVALHVEPETAQIHAVSDPLPQILEGIPLDVRSVSLRMDRPDFILNPTSCDQMAITGAATSALGQAAALSQRFQVGGCSGLPFKPKLFLRLKGSVKRSSNPKLIASLSARAGDANISRAQVKLPHAVFLDQSHIRTVCTRVQFAADQCPAGSVYGAVEATTPLLGYPLSGSVYLRSSSHKLPDLVAKLKGPATQPIEIDLVGKTDAVKAALRNTFEAVPDAPVTNFRLELFGGKRGLVEMSDGFCSHRRADVKLDGQNGKAYDTRPLVAAKCPKRTKGGKGHHHGATRGGGR